MKAKVAEIGLSEQMKINEMPKNEKRLHFGDAFRKPTLIKFYIDI